MQSEKNQSQHKGKGASASRHDNRQNPEAESSRSESAMAYSLNFFPFARDQKNVQVHLIDISFRSILLILATIAVLYLGYQLMEVILVVLFGFIISSAVVPIVKKLEQKGIKKGVSIFSVYILGVVGIFALSALVIVPLSVQLRSLADSVPDYVDEVVDQVNDRAGTGLDSESITLELFDFTSTASIIDKIPQNLNGLETFFTALSSFGGAIGILVLSIVLSVYIVYDHDSFLDLLLVRIMDKEKRELARKQLYEVEKKLGMWLRGQLLVCTIVGLMAFLLLIATGVPFAVPLAIFTGLMVAVPTIGPFISGIPIVIIAFLSSGWIVGLIVLIGYIVIQQVENSFLVPRIMGSVVGVKPIVVFLGVLIGLALGGIPGAFITVPVLVILKILYDSYKKYAEIER